MGVERVDMLMMLDNNVISAEIRCGNIDPSGARPGTIANIVAQRNNDAIGSGQYRLPEGKVIGRSARINPNSSDQLLHRL